MQSPGAKGNFCVYLPVGNIGLELEAGKRHGSELTGCRVRGWTKASALATRVRKGCTILAVDDESVDKLPFHAIVRRIRISVRRKITFGPSSDATLAVRMEKSHTCPRLSADNKENVQPSKTLSPSHFLQLLQSEKRCSSPPRPAPVVEPAIAAAVTTGEDQFLREEVNILKKNAKGSAGEILFMKFKLEKLRAQKEAPMSSRLEAPLPDVPLLRHWRRMQLVLHEMLGVPTDAEAVQKVSANVEEELAVQVALNKRLEDQLRAWVEQTISMHRQEASAQVRRDRDDGGEAPSAASSLPIAGPPTEAPRVPTPAPQDKSVASDEHARRLWLSARRSMSGPLSPGPCLSPASFKEHMSRLRNENRSIKSDITKFRANLQKLRGEWVDEA